jgi:pimeloyl-ACP methyl ester carboxylesterase
MTSPEQFCDVGRGVRLCYRTCGDPSAEPLLLITGLGQQLNSWPSAFCDALAARGHHVLRFDNRDIGRSSRSPFPPPSKLQLAIRRFPSTQYTLADMAEDTDGLIAGLGLDSAHIVGASMGGMIGQTLAARHPERVRTLTSIISTTGAARVGGPALSTWRRMATPPPKDKERWLDRTVEMWRHIASRGFPFDEVQVRTVARESWERGGGTALRVGVTRQLAAIMKSGDRTTELHRITAPTLVIHGDRDRMVHPSGARATARAIPGARLYTIAGMGHDLPVGAWPELIDLITQHVQGTSRRISAGATAAEQLQTSAT